MLVHLTIINLYSIKLDLDSIRFITITINNKEFDDKNNCYEHQLIIYHKPNQLYQKLYY